MYEGKLKRSCFFERYSNTAAGSWSWPWAWVFLGIYALSVLTNSLFLMRNNPEIVAERGQPKETKKWDVATREVRYRLVPGVW